MTTRLQFCGPPDIYRIEGRLMRYGDVIDVDDLTADMLADSSPACWIKIGPFIDDTKEAIASTMRDAFTIADEEPE